MPHPLATLTSSGISPHRAYSSSTNSGISPHRAYSSSSSFNGMGAGGGSRGSAARQTSNAVAAVMRTAESLKKLEHQQKLRLLAEVMK